jgi:hypothetical protein
MYIIRATKSTWPAVKIECEVACIRLMAARTKLPVPTIICYGSAADEYGCRWILSVVCHAALRIFVLPRS